MKKSKVHTQQQLDQRADALNPNRGSPGTNVTYAKVHGNRGKLKNPNQQSTRPAAPQPPSARKARP